MMRALIIGGGGYVGGRLAPRLAREGWEVTTLVLPGRSPEREALPPGVRILYGDRESPALLDVAMAGRPDVVFDLIAYRPADTDAIVRAGAGRLGRLIHLSTVSVYREYPATGRASEETALRFAAAAEGYGPQKAACERILERAAAERSFPYVILRAAPIMGPADPCSRESYFVARILAGRPILHPGPADGRLWILFIEDLIDALVRAATAPVLGRVFHLAHDEAPSLRQHVEALASGVGRRAPDLSTTAVEELARLGFRLYGFPYARTVDVPPDTTAAQEGLGWRATPYPEALTRTLHDPCGAAGAATCPGWPGRDTTQARLSGAHPWLHRALEERVLAGLATAPGPDADAVLGWLAGEPAGNGPLQRIAAERWPAPVGPFPVRPLAERGQEGAAAPRFVSVPEPLHRRLTAMGARPGPAAGGEESAPAAGAPAAGAPADLVAALELDRWKTSRAWLFTLSPPPPAPYYGRSTEPLQVDIVPLARALEGATTPAERLLVESRGPVDAVLMDRHLRACQQQGLLLIEDLEAWARIYVVGFVRWLPRAVRNALGLGHHDDERRQHGSETSILGTFQRQEAGSAGWVLSHAVARLLCRAGVVAPTAIRMGAPSREGRPVAIPATAALCRSDRGAHVVDVVARRVIEIPAAVANALDGDSSWTPSLPGIRRTPRGWLCTKG